MTHRTLIIGLTLLAATSVVASAEVYTWTDDAGTVHFSEDAGSVPPEVRKKHRTSEAPAAAAAEAVPPAETGDEQRQEPATKNAAPPLATDDFGGRTRDQWQQDLQTREAEMSEVRTRLDELADLARRAPPRSPEQVRLVTEHQALLTKFNEMKARYFELVEAARKEGLQVDLQQ